MTAKTQNILVAIDISCELYLSCLKNNPNHTIKTTRRRTLDASFIWEFERRKRGIPE